MVALLDTLSQAQLEAMAKSHYESRFTAQGLKPFWGALPKSAQQLEIAAMRDALEHVR